MMAQTGGPATAVRAHEEIFAYWASKRSAGRLPSRVQIDPADFKRHLPTISLTEVLAEANDYRFRLAGTGLYEVYGREITGRSLAEVYNSQSADYWRSELDKVVEDRRPGVGVHNFAWRGAGHISILWLRLPLAADGERVNMILGYDAILGVQGGRLSSGIRAA
ncbi:MAG TPA: PAS domain-containing protein [Caulobacteraceae bacterium]|nr:PAS domain-containing protein [Caulobacteraceae bacterium]